MPSPRAARTPRRTASAFVNFPPRWATVPMGTLPAGLPRRGIRARISRALNGKATFSKGNTCSGAHLSGDFAGGPHLFSGRSPRVVRGAFGICGRALPLTDDEGPGDGRKPPNGEGVYLRPVGARARGRQRPPFPPFRRFEPSPMWIVCRRDIRGNTEHRASSYISNPREGSNTVAIRGE